MKENNGEKSENKHVEMKMAKISIINIESQYNVSGSNNIGENQRQ